MGSASLILKIERKNEYLIILYFTNLVEDEKNLWV